MPSTEVPAAEVTATEVPAAEVTATEVPAAEVPSTEMSPAEVHAAEMTAAEVTATEMTAAEVTATEMTAAEVTAAEVTAAEVTATEVTATEVTATEVTAAAGSTKSFAHRARHHARRERGFETEPERDRRCENFSHPTSHGGLLPPRCSKRVDGSARSMEQDFMRGNLHFWRVAEGPLLA